MIADVEHVSFRKISAVVERQHCTRDLPFSLVTCMLQPQSVLRAVCIRNLPGFGCM